MTILRTVKPLFIVLFMALSSWTPLKLKASAYRTQSTLVRLYESTNGDMWHNKGGWLDGPVSDWYGVRIDNGRVTEIELYYNNLTGPLPADIRFLTGLESLRLFNNKISGEIPAELGDLPNLEHISMSNNLLTGPIPSELGQSDELSYVDLSHNQLSGEIPAELAELPRLRLIYMSNNLLTGPIPSELGQSLRYVRLSHNQLSGPIRPVCLRKVYAVLC